MIDYMRRLPEAARAIRAAKELESHDRWEPQRLAAHQRERLLAIIRLAAVRSPYYRERYAGIELADDLDLEALPTLDKSMMVEHFDDIVTDRRLTLAGVEAHLAELERAPGADQVLFGEYRAMASGGTTGRRGVFVYGREDWTSIMAGTLRWTGAWLGQPPRLPRRRRLAAIMALSPLHMTARMGSSIDVGVHRMLRLDARSPLAELVERLNAHQPEALVAYASVAALLAEEQLVGRLRIAPEVVATTSEVRTEEMEERIVAAWGHRPFNCYAATETGNIAADCERHAGLHVFDDLVYVEVVDDDNRAVPTGKPGSKLLVTNLVNRAQPLIRFELTDLVTRATEPCGCGRPYALLTAVDGRSDDVLVLSARAGGIVKVHPLTIRSPLAHVSSLLEYRVIHGDRGLRVEAVIAGKATAASVLAEIEQRLHEALARGGVEPPPISVDAVTEIPRHPHSGKHKLIESQVDRDAVSTV